MSNRTFRLNGDELRPLIDLLLVLQPDVSRSSFLRKVSVELDKLCEAAES